MSAEDYCELCDLPKSQCIHGMPPPPPAPPKPATAPRTTRSATPRKASPRKASAAAPAAPTRTVPRRWTPPDAFTSTILEVLAEAGGQLDSDELFSELETRMSERLTAADHETTPEGELRWRYAARRARQALIADGVMTKARPGVWALAKVR